MKKMLSKRQVKELVLYSPQHIARLEAVGLFPKRVQLGANRVGWVEAEVLEWLQARIDARDQQYARCSRWLLTTELLPQRFKKAQFFVQGISESIPLIL